LSEGRACEQDYELAMHRLMRDHGGEPRKIVTDKLRSYGVAHRELLPEPIHLTDQYANNRAEQSREPTRRRERGMRKFKSIRQAQRFLGAHAAVSNLFNLGRYLVRSLNGVGQWPDFKWRVFCGLRKLSCQYPLRTVMSDPL
jgi:hypothetical protein